MLNAIGTTLHSLNEFKETMIYLDRALSVGETLAFIS